MLNYLTVPIDNQLFDQAKQYAVARGASLGTIIGNYLTQMATAPVNTQQAERVLETLTRYSANQLSRKTVMELLGIDYGELILMMAEHQLPLPSLPEPILTEMATQFVKIWQEFTMTRTVLAIPDSGPLISLSVANRLDLLLQLDMPIYVVDHVIHECTKDLSRMGAQTIMDFIRTHPQIIQVAETFVGSAARQEREAGGTLKRRGLGEAAIAEFVANLDDKLAPDQPVLILFEDSDLYRINVFVQGNVHLLSTKAFLIGLEECGIVPSAEEIWQTILLGGRRPSAKLIDQPAPRRNSYWKPLRFNSETVGSAGNLVVAKVS